MISNPPLAPKHQGLKCCLQGLINKFTLPGRHRPNKGDKFMLREVLRHAQLLATRYYQGHLPIVDEFLQLYCLDELRPTEQPVVTYPTSTSARNIPFGTCSPLPLKDFPPGRTRIRMRGPDDPVTIFVKSLDGLREFIPTAKDGHWIPFAEQGRNHTSSTDH